MRNALLVASREYAENARTKGFWIGILMLPVILVVAIQVTRWLENDATPTRYFTVVDQEGHYLEEIDRRLDLRYAGRVLGAFQSWTQSNFREEYRQAPIDFENMPPMDLKGDADAYLELLIQSDPKAFDSLLEEGGIQRRIDEVADFLREDASEFETPRRLFVRVELPAEMDPAGEPREIAGGLKEYLNGDQKLANGDQQIDLFALLVIPQGVDNAFQPQEERGLIGEIADGLTKDKAPKVEYWSINLADSDLPNQLQSILNRELRRSQYLVRGMDTVVVNDVQGMHLPVKKLDPGKAEGEEEVSQADVLRDYAPIGFVYLLWISIMQVASMLLNNTVEEKSNRIIEVLLSSVTAWELMAGKLIGIAAIGITILTCWLGSAAGLLWYWSSPEAVLISNLLDVIFDDTLLPAFIFYFLGGYFMYAGIFLAIGSVCNTIKEAQNFMGPVMMIMMVPIFTMMFIPKDPHGTLATVLSWIPLYTPFIMMNRAAAEPPMFDLVGTSILLVVSNIAVLWLCGRIFRTGILRTGQPPRLVEMLRWMRRRAD